MIQDFEDFADYQEIQITYVKEDDWEFTMNKDLAEILVMNLIKNAIIHNHPQGEINIRLTASYFIIENTSDDPSCRQTHCSDVLIKIRIGTVQPG